MIRKIKVSDLDRSTILKKIISDPPVFIIGSAISTFEPSILPTGYKATHVLVHKLFTGNEIMKKYVSLDIVNEICETLPFEQLFESCPDKNTARRILSDMCEACEPNKLHQEIVKLLLDRKIHSIITTNYDRCLEKVLENIGTSIPIVIKEDDYKGQKPPYIFKIHGSSENEGESMVFDLKNETRLEKWKKNLMHEMLSGHLCIFFGYSGRDFEICPEIESNDNISGLIWCNKVSITPRKNAEYILSKNTKKAFWTLAVGDIVDFINTIFCTDIHVFHSEQPLSGIAIHIAASYSWENLSIWALNILSVMGYPSIALNCANELLENVESKSELYRNIVSNIGSLYYEMGNYKQSVKYLKRLIRLIKSTPEKIAVRYNIFESRRTGIYVISAIFSYLYATITLAMAKRHLTNDEKNELMKMKYNRKDDMYSSIFRFLPFLQPLFKSIREKSREKVITLAEEAGDLGLKNIMKPDHVFDFSANDNNYIKEIERFRQLGRFIEETVTYRRYIEWKVRHNNTLKEDFTSLGQYRDKCIQRGIYPEVIKCSLILNDEDSYMRFSRKCVYSFYGKKLILHHWSHKTHKRSQQ